MGNIQEAERHQQRAIREHTMGGDAERARVRKAELVIHNDPGRPTARRFIVGNMLPTGSLGASDVNNNDGVSPSSFST
jgi:hypothetical protein